ncbi:membrane-bound lytic murein transglycosylase A [Geoalkalibacter ferrihydriticus]|uniref:peptidoglycan lytic exotransglycosylase n=1 Tax=Geoalkalibacter ferrihydriticus TaxID=392333 RepID=A0A1G9IPQ1_9BACT|nr:MltA domain-containing protein [Geoalkalibacter ferrihydriticus]SDL26894.1 membrane-bound lytic murein transglycosylase A [Geoalkalibacter ferrihydriticus]
MFFQRWIVISGLLGLLGGCLHAPADIAPTEPRAVREVTTYDRLEGWAEGDPRPGFEVFRNSCRAIGGREPWRDVCAAAAEIDGGDRTAVLRFFHTHFLPHRLQKPDGDSSGLITGYYVPNLRGSRTPSQRYAWPLYGPPDDMLRIDMRDLHPALSDYQLRGRVEGRRVVPYYTRAEIEAGKGALAGRELFWVDDPVELFFLHIQGSGRIHLESGEGIMVNYADMNGHPYTSIGRLLLERGAMTRDQMSMQNIRAWARDNPESTQPLLNENPRYIFFRELPGEVENPPGALGVPLTPRYSLAVDPRFVPLGAPVFLATAWPMEERALRRLMGAQDTGGAIKGEVRADFYWGLGEEGGHYAGRMRQQGQMWVLLPRTAGAGD